MRTDLMLLIAALAFVLAGCDTGEVAGTKASSTPVAAAAVAQSASQVAAPPQVKKAERKAPTFDFVGLWMEDRECGPTDHYMHLARDGSANAWGQHGRWSLREGGIHFDMEEGEYADETLDAWSGTLGVRVVSRDQIVVRSESGNGVPHFRCPEN